MNNVHYLQINVAADPAVLLRIFGVCHQRKMTIIFARYDESAAKDSVILGVKSTYMQAARLIMWLDRLVNVVGVYLIEQPGHRAEATSEKVPWSRHAGENADRPDS